MNKITKNKTIGVFTLKTKLHMLKNIIIFLFIIGALFERTSICKDLLQMIIDIAKKIKY